MVPVGTGSLEEMIVRSGSEAAHETAQEAARKNVVMGFKSYISAGVTWSGGSPESDRCR